MHVVLIGPPGSGKGTQAKLISDYYKLPHISMGELCREEAKKKTQQGVFVKKLIDAGRLVPDELTVRLLKKRLKKKDCDNGYILDGYPRNLNQCKLLGPKFHVDYAIYLKVSASVVIKRLTSRWQCAKCGAIYGTEVKPEEKGICDKCKTRLHQRDDDREAAIRARLRTFNTLTRPLINYYKRAGVLHTVNGNQDVERIFQSIKKILR